MTYTKAQRKALAKIFTKVHDKMERSPPWTNKLSSRYICTNLADEGWNLWQVRAAIAIVTERMLWRVSLEFWLERNGYIDMQFRTAATDNHDSFECRQMHQYRLRWLKNLIREFST
jgi:hypothetical protein